MSEAFGPDFITVTDEDGNEFELELIDTLEHDGITYYAMFPAVAENEDTGEPVDVDADDEEYGLVIMKGIEENGEEILSTLDSDEELDTIYNLFMERFFEEEDEELGKISGVFPARCVMGSFKPTFFKRDAPSRRGLQASRPPYEVSWKLEAVKRRGGDPPAITCRF